MNRNVRISLSAAAAVVAAFATASRLPVMARMRPASAFLAQNARGPSQIPGSVLPRLHLGRTDALIQGPNEDGIRDHGWRVFRSLVMGREEPLWKDWQTKCEVLGSLEGCDLPQPPPAVPPAGDPRLVALNPSLWRGMYLATARLRLMKGLFTPEQLFVGTPSGGSASNGNQFAMVLFNPSAARTITETAHVSPATQSGARRAEITAALANLDTAHGQVVFPNDAILIKTIWELVPTPIVDGQVTKFTVWDPANPAFVDPSTRTTLQAWNSWKTYVTIDESGKPCLGKDYGDQPTPISCFYSVPLTKSDMQNLFGIGPMTCSTICPDVVPGPIPTGQDTGNSLVLLGFHVMTREQPNWTWQTFYWSKGAFTGADAQLGYDNPARSSNQPGDARWSHYVMRTTLSDAPRTAGGDKPLAFSPYLEGFQTNGMISNCMSCHRYAVFHDNPRQGEGLALAQGLRPAGPGDYFTNNALGTSFVWSLANENQPPQLLANRHSLKDRLSQLNLANIARARSAAAMRHR